MTNEQRVEAAIRAFNWGNYSIHDAEVGLADYPAEQHWPAALAQAVIAALEESRPVIASFTQPDPEDGSVTVTYTLPADHPLAQALQPGAEHHTREEWAAIRAAEGKQP